MDVEEDAACPSGQTKLCSLSIDVDTFAAGDATLEIVEQGAGALDRATIHIRPARQIHLAVQANGEPVDRGEVGRFHLKLGDEAALEATLFDDAGNTMVFRERALTHEYRDPDVLRQKPDDIFGSAHVERLSLLGAGDTEVAVRATGAEATIRFRVLP